MTHSVTSQITPLLAKPQPFTAKPRPLDRLDAKNYLKHKINVVQGAVSHRYPTKLCLNGFIYVFTELRCSIMGNAVYTVVLLHCSLKMIKLFLWGELMQGWVELSRMWVEPEWILVRFSLCCSSSSWRLAVAIRSRASPGWLPSTSRPRLYKISRLKACSRPAPSGFFRLSVGTVWVCPR